VETQWRYIRSVGTSCKLANRIFVNWRAVIGFSRRIMASGPPHPDEDVELLRAWKQGDAAAGNRLVRRHFEAVYCFFATKVDDASELAQRTFLATLESADRFRGESAFRTYLFAIARRVLYNHYRGLKRYRARFSDFAQVSAVDLEPTASAVFAGRQEQHLLIAALRTLPLPMQITLELHYWEAMKLADIAVVLELPPGTVKSRLHRARGLLKEAVERLASSRELRDSTLEKLDDWAKGVRDQVAKSAGPGTDES
jgi:RNA polymerase sigma-70 factor (ECF subfamily)